MLLRPTLVANPLSGALLAFPQECVVRLNNPRKLRFSDVLDRLADLYPPTPGGHLVDAELV
jgi:hypothetical protein